MISIRRCSWLLVVAFVLFAVPPSGPANAQDAPSSPDELGGPSAPSNPPVGSGSEDDAELPAEGEPTAVQGAIDGYLDSYLATGTLDFGAPVSYPPTQPGPATLTASEAVSVLDVVYAHRLNDEEDIEALLARDVEVAAAYSSLLNTGTLTTPVDDPTAVLHHLSLLRESGTRGGFTVSSAGVVSVGIVSRPPGCLVNLGGFVYNWPPGGGTTYGFCSNDLLVYLTVRQPNGQIFRSTTRTTTCGGQQVYGFRQVPSGTAEVIARPLAGCCREARSTFTITCPPGPGPRLPCVPAGTNQLANLTMGPWNPPGYWGAVLGAPATGARVWIANRDNACANYGSASTNQGLFTVVGCLPHNENVFLYAEADGRIGRVDVPDSLSCGQGDGPYNIPLLEMPRVSGVILNWQPSWHTKVGAMATGCTQQECGGSAASKITHLASPTGAYSLTLKPGRWLLSSWRNLGTCVNANRQQVAWTCERVYGYVDLEPDQELPIDLPAPPTTCACPL